MPRPNGLHGGGLLPVLAQLAGMGIVAVSLWALPLGGTLSKALLVLWAVLGIVPVLGRSGLLMDALLAVLLWGALTFWVLMAGHWGNAAGRLAGNLAILPLGLALGHMRGRVVLAPVMVPLLIYVLLDSHFMLTSEGWRLNNPFLFLALFVLALAARDSGKPALSAAGVWPGCLAGIAIIGVFASQTRIAILAMAIVLVGRVRLHHARTWLWGLPLVGAGLWGVADYLPRILYTHASGRLAYWQMFWQQWQEGSASQRWLGFGVGAIEGQLQKLQSASSFGALHNDHFHMLYETGLLGAGIWGAGWGVMIWLVRSSALAVGILLAVMVTMVTDNTLSYGHYLLASGVAAGVAWSRRTAEMKALDHA
ncbi:O-antigen ligase domain-containing protein [Thalassospira profundimaris]|uniref:O-antigen ligase domain-containing protein n=1 Tax=Thalassospira profundimaris TaxID=502049 RepID=UPI000DED6B53|nr:O-antigen ligase domain-containing protein [Thalassospira profundimaris]